MADIELLFGVKGGGTISGESGKGIKEHLEKIVEAIEPLKIKVEADSASVGKFKDEITKLADHSVQQAKRAQAAWSKVPPNPNGGGGGGGGKKNPILEKDTTEYYKAVTKLEKAQTSLRENLRKWTAASTGASAADYKNLEAQEKKLKALLRLLNTGKLPSLNFDKHFSKISAAIATAADNINLNEEHALHAEKLTKGVEGYGTALKKASTELDTMQRNLAKWSMASEAGSKSNAKYKEYEQLTDDVQSLIYELNQGKYTSEEFEERLRDIRDSALLAASAIKNAGEATSSIKKLTVDTKEYAPALRVVAKEARTMQDNLNKWTTASFASSKSNSSYRQYENIRTEVKQLELDLRRGSLTLDEFNKRLGDIRVRADKAFGEIHNAGEDTPAIRKATEAIEAYYKAQKDAVKFGDEISRDKATGLWVTQNENLKSLVKRLNETRQAYIEATKAAVNFSDTEKEKFNVTDKAASQSLNEAIEDRNRKSVASQEAKRKSEEAAAVDKATKAIKEYYDAHMECVKLSADMVRGDDGQWQSLSGRFSELAERLNRVQEAFDTAQIAKDNFSDEDRSDIIAKEVVQQERLNEAIQAQKRAMEGKAVKAYYDQVEKVDTLLIKTKKNLENWTAAKTGKSSESYRGLEETVAILEEMRRELKEGKVALDGLDEKFDAAAASIKGFNADIELAGENTKSVKTKLSDLAKTLGVSFSIADAFHKAIEIGREMIDTVTEIDTAMTELKKVTDETDATYDRFLENAEPRARALGATVADVVSATADFARLGKTIGDASDLADAAIVYKNVGDGIEDIATASESIISTMQAFGVEARDAMSIVDSFNNVGNNFAVSSKGIGDALLNSAASLHAAGNNIHESIALIAAAM